MRTVLLAPAILFTHALMSCAHKPPVPVIIGAPSICPVAAITAPSRATDPLYVTAQRPLPQQPLPARVKKKGSETDLLGVAAFPATY